MAYARLLADTVSPRSMAVMKAQVWKSYFQDFGEALETADAEMPPSFKWPDFKEGVAISWRSARRNSRISERRAKVQASGPAARACCGLLIRCPPLSHSRAC